MHIRLFVGTQQRTHRVFQRCTAVFQVFQRIQAQDAGAFIVGHAAAQQPAIPHADGVGVSVPAIALGHNVGVGDGGKELLAVGNLAGLGPADVAEKVNVSLAHTNADYKTAKAAFEAGANHAVHLYNAMPPFSHRAPGVVGAVYDCKHVMPEIICDGIHIHPATVRATFEMMGADRMILISDSMRATGMPDGQYTLGGLDVKVVGKLATLVSDGAIAGSATNLMDCMRTVVKEMGLPLETAVACATMNPAKSLGVNDEYGSITEGKKANIVLLDKDLELQAVIKDGMKL